MQKHKRSPYLRLDDASPSVQTHLGIIQGVIQRMSSNSTSCKAWCITIVSAILVIIADKGKSNLAALAILPTLLFATLDAYYLALEKGFRNSYNAFIDKLHSGKLLPSDLYSMVPTGNLKKLQIDAFVSFSVWGFYGSLIALIIAAWCLIL